MIVVVDTNVLVSGFLNPFGKPAAIQRLIIEGSVKAAYDVRLITEYREVLHRPKFPFTSEQINSLIDFFIAEGLLVAAIPLTFKLPDPDDEIFQEAALSIHAEALITGNKKHFPQPNYAQVKILSPAEFLELFRSN